MKFGEKCKELRSQKGMTQIDVARQIGVGRRTYIDYENSGVHPKKREVYYKLAELFGCDVNYLLTEDEEFLLSAGEKYGRRGKNQAQELVSEISGLFAGGTLSDTDKDAVMRGFFNIGITRYTLPLNLDGARFIRSSSYTIYLTR